MLLQDGFIFHRSLFLSLSHLPSSILPFSPRKIILLSLHKFINIEKLLYIIYIYTDLFPAISLPPIAGDLSNHPPHTGM